MSRPDNFFLGFETRDAVRRQDDEASLVQMQHTFGTVELPGEVGQAFNAVNQAVTAVRESKAEAARLEAEAERLRSESKLSVWDQMHRAGSALAEQSERPGSDPRAVFAGYIALHNMSQHLTIKTTIQGVRIPPSYLNVDTMMRTFDGMKPGAPLFLRASKKLVSGIIVGNVKVYTAVNSTPQPESMQLTADVTAPMQVIAGNELNTEVRDVTFASRAFSRQELIVGRVGVQGYLNELKGTVRNDNGSCHEAHGMSPSNRKQLESDLAAANVLINQGIELNTENLEKEIQSVITQEIYAEQRRRERRSRPRFR